MPRRFIAGSSPPPCPLARLPAMTTRTLRCSLTVLLTMLLLGGCEQPRITPDYSRPLPEGASSLRPTLDDRKHDLAEAFRNRNTELHVALDASARWFDAPSSRQYFPFEGVTHEQARASVLAFRDLLMPTVDCFFNLVCNSKNTWACPRYRTPISSFFQS